MHQREGLVAVTAEVGCLPAHIWVGQEAEAGSEARPGFQPQGPWLPIKLT